VSDKTVFRRLCEASMRPASRVAREAHDAFYSSDAQIHVVHPFNTLQGPARPLALW